MRKYYLDDIVTTAALSQYKNTWLNLNISMFIQEIIKDTNFISDWDEGIENWVTFSQNNKSIGLLCTKIPFAIVSNEELKNRIHCKYPHILILKVQDFQTDEIILNANICKLAIEPQSQLENRSYSLLDFYVSTV